MTTSPGFILSKRRTPDPHLFQSAGDQTWRRSGAAPGRRCARADLKACPVVIVRKAKIEDVEGMALVMAAVAEEGVIGTEPPVDIADRARRFRDLIEGQEPATAWVLLDDGGHIVGNAGVDEPFPGVLHFGMAILAEARGKGGGRALLEAILEHAQESGSHKVELEVWIDNARAIALYASAGFEVEGLRRNHYRRRNGRLRSALIMARLLRYDDPGAPSTA